jgi:2-polyprenyl-3-methyl-5-hydroxy-6-metoxy-1,4-benzoquinol methylase
MIEKARGWNQRSIDKSLYFNGQPRGFDAYSLALGLTLDDFTGKRILDLGAGKEVQLSKDLADKALNTQIVEMSPDFIYSNTRRIARTSDSDAILLIGLGQSLPTRDESFDRVFGMHVMEHIDADAVFLKLIQESIRVLKPNGKACFGPIFYFWRQFIQTNSEFSQIFSNQKASFVETNIPETYGREPIYDGGMKYGYMTLTRLTITKIN